jgi:hypothetical protein
LSLPSEEEEEEESKYNPTAGHSSALAVRFNFIVDHCIPGGGGAILKKKVRSVVHCDYGDAQKQQY